MEKIYWFVGKRKNNFINTTLPKSSFEVLRFEDDEDLNFECLSIEECLEEEYKGHYKYIVGPFKTERGAKFFARSPKRKDFFSIEEIERLAKQDEWHR